jgi:DNA-3-methyladenine glycosylase
VISNLTNGPGKIGQALHLDLSDNHIDVTKKGALYITEGVEVSSQDILATPRIGITKAKENPWRFVLRNEDYEKIEQLISTVDKL